MAILKKEKLHNKYINYKNKERLHATNYKEKYFYFNCFLDDIVFSIKGYAIYVPSGGSYEDSNTSLADERSPGALKIYYMINGHYEYSSVSFSQGTITKEGNESSYTQEGYYPKTQYATVHPNKFMFF